MMFEVLLLGFAISQQSSLTSLAIMSIYDKVVLTANEVDVNNSHAVDLWKLTGHKMRSCVSYWSICFFKVTLASSNLSQQEIVDRKSMNEVIFPLHACTSTDAHRLASFVTFQQKSLA